MPKFPPLRVLRQDDDRTEERFSDFDLPVLQETKTWCTTTEATPARRSTTHLSTFTDWLHADLHENVPALPTENPPLTPDVPFPAVAVAQKEQTATLPMPSRRTTGLLDVATTQSLVSALQNTLEPKPTRPLLVIPAEIRRQPRAKVTPISKQRATLKHGLVMGATLLGLLFTLISLTPLSNGFTGVPIVGNAVQFVQAGQTQLNSILDRVVNNPVPQVVPTQAPAAPPMTIARSQYVAIARQDAINAGIPPDAFVRQIQQESGFNPNAVSPAGAVGIAQFLPSTAYGLGFDPYDPIASLQGAANYMARLSNQYGGDYAKALGAYNAGPGTVQTAINEGGANWLAYMPLETQNYVRIIMAM